MKQILLSLVILVWSCSDQTTETRILQSVGGIIYENDMRSKGSQVFIDNKKKFSVTTNTRGEFTIFNVPDGMHRLRVLKNHPNGSFSEINKSFFLSSDTVFDGLVLPEPTNLYEIKSISGTALKIEWSKSYTSGYREYKIYRDLNPALDEQSGELVYVTVDKNDTSFIDQKLNHNEIYYYRVFILNEYGLLGGSNIVSGTTDNENLFVDGGFELDNTISENRIIEKEAQKVSIDTNIAFEGQRSLRFNMNQKGYVRMYHKLFNNLKKYSYYDISFYYRVEGPVDEKWSNFRVGFKYMGEFHSFKKYTLFESKDTYEENTWYYFDRTIVITEERPIEFFIEVNNMNNLWIDGLHCEED